MVNVRGATYSCRVSSSSASTPASNEPSTDDLATAAAGGSDPGVESEPSVDEAQPAYVGHPLLGYFTARIVLLFAAGAGCYLLGARGILLLVLAFLISGLLSFLLLGRQRDGMAGVFHGYFRRINDRIDRSAKAEDDIVDIQER